MPALRRYEGPLHYENKRAFIEIDGQLLLLVIDNPGS